VLLKGKTAFVTGAARGNGNGRAIALKLAEEGADVAVGDILYEEARGVADEIAALGRRHLAVKMDLGKFEDVERGFQQIRKELGPVDILVNNAAIMTNMATISKMKIEAWEKEIAVNLSGAFFCVKQVFDAMAERKWGRIINISSIAGIMGGFGQCSYSASKAGLIGLTKTIALEGARFGVTANALILGVIGTDAFRDLPDEIKGKIQKRVPMRSEGSTQDVANTVAFLASEGSRYMTGASIVMSGGLDLFVM
jgi:3-oxoacyl-[acyl-carrier protein] reductase